MKILRPIRLAQFLCCLAATAAHAESAYTVRQSPGAAPDLEITLALPPGDAPASHKLSARGAAWGLQEQVRAPRCDDGTRLAKDGDGSWIAPPGCRHVTWTVSPPAIEDGTIDVSAQASLFLAQPKWTLLSEPTSLLRETGIDPQQAVLRAADAATPLFGATPAAQGGWLIPADNNAPEFYVVGPAPVQSEQVGDFRVHHVADNPQRVKQLGLVASHAQALRFLARIVYTDAPVPEADRSLMIVWIGIDTRLGHAGGAAGSRSFLANYPIGGGDHAQDHAAVTFMILAHEQFHQLADARRGDMPGLPGWINESIAQYYGLRAMREALGDDAAAAALTRRFIDPGRPVEQRFAGSEALFATDRPRALDLAYRQGATFWAELDRALHTASGGAASLDGYIPDLLRMTFPEDGSLPSAFLSYLRQWNDNRIDQIISNYVGETDAAAGSGG